MSATEPVLAFYAAVARGDVPAIVALLHPDLEWTEAAGFPYYSGTWTSARQVIDNLLIPLDRDWSRFAVVADEVVALDASRVLSLGAYEGTARATGQSMRAPFAHLWRVRDGQLCRFDMYTDTAVVRAALSPDAFSER